MKTKSYCICPNCKTEIEIGNTDNQKINDLEKIIKQLETSNAILSETLKSKDKDIEELNNKKFIAPNVVRGKAQELILEDILIKKFPFDKIHNVTKRGKSGDILHEVRNNNNTVGTIIIESKNTQQFSFDWISKLKDEQLNTDSEIAVLVTRALPSKMIKKDIKIDCLNGVWICSVDVFEIACKLLREQLIEISNNLSLNINADTRDYLFDYITSTQFSNTFSRITNTHQDLINELEKEKNHFLRSYERKRKMIENSSIDSFSILQGIETAFEMHKNLKVS